MFKNVNIILLFGLSALFECNGHLGILDIVGGAHERIHSTVEKVAGGILGGLNVNFQGNIGVGANRYPNRTPPPPVAPGGGQTIVVVVKDDDHNNQHGMNPNHHGQGSYGNNNYPKPGYNNDQQGQWNGYQNQNKPYGNQNYGQNQNGNYGGHQQYPGQGQDSYQQRPNENNGNYGGIGNNQQNNQEYPTNGNGDANSNHGSSGGNNYGQQTTPPQQETRPTFGNVNEVSKQPVTEKKTEKDEPLFVPLNPNQYNFEGDKGANNSPKRETDIDKNTEDKDEEFPIDIRFQDQ